VVEVGLAAAFDAADSHSWSREAVKPAPFAQCWMAQVFAPRCANGTAPGHELRGRNGTAPTQAGESSELRDRGRLDPFVTSHDFCE